MRWFAFPALLILAAACGESNPSPAESETAPLSLQLLAASDSQIGIEGVALTAPLVVHVRRGGVPERGVPVVWAAERGTITVLQGTTDASGFARAVWTMPEGPGLISATARVATQPALQARFTAVVRERLVALPLASDSIIGPDSTVTVRVQVRGARDGWPRASVPVRWELPAPHVPTITLTDAAGIATMVWPTGTMAGRRVATAVVEGSLEPSPSFTVTVRPGAPVGIEATIPVSSLLPDPRLTTEISLRSVDAFRNAVGGQHIDLQEPTGLLRIEMLDTLTDSLGWGKARVIPTGRFGVATLLARLNNGAALPVGSVSLLSEVNLVQLYFVGTPIGFRSYRNGTQPAVDTIPVGMTGRWVLEPFDYDLHNVQILADSGFVGGGVLPYANPSFVRVTFTRPGTYRYVDTETGTTGTVVVIP